MQKVSRQLRELKQLGKPMRLAADGWGTRWQTLIAVLMSARTRDEVTIAVARKLFIHYPTLKDLAGACSDELQRHIRPINFYLNKANAISTCAKIILKKHHGKIPDDVAALVLLPGVGRKTANVYLAQYGKSVIGVDTHVSYIARFLGWSRHHDPKKIERDIEKLFPKRQWRNVNTVCVQFGKTYQSRRKKDMLLTAIRSL